MKIKKLVFSLLAFVMAAGLMAGCASSKTSHKTSTNNTKEKTTKQNAKTTTKSKATKTDNESKKILVVYYSATGTTKDVAENIADITDGDLFEIKPKDPYTDEDLDWTDDNSRVSKEHEDESLRDVKLVSTKVDNWDSYDTVYIGYPIWWGIAAWPVDNFVKDNNFEGKTVIPFCTSASSGIGDSGNLLKDMAGTGNWKDGEGFSSGASKSEISSWIENLKL